MRRGFSLLELLMAVAILATVTAMAMGGWLRFAHKANHANTQAALDNDVRRVIERFRFEMRNTARETIIFYPEGREPYEAVGFALPSDADGDGFMDMDGSNLLWRQTAVYHVWTHTPHQMRRTLFSNRNQDATYGERYAQVAAVVSSGTGDGACLAGESASTRVLFENLFTGRLWHATSSYDGYAPDANTRERISFGSLPLGPGEHTINFTITDKNPNATDRKLRMDRVSASVTGWPFEAERLATGGIEGAAPAFVGQGLASAAYGLVAPTANDGDRLSVTVHNDAIEVCVFIGEGRNVAFSNTVVRFDAASTPQGFSRGVSVAKLDGQFGPDRNWSCAEQTSHFRNDYFFPTNCLVRIPVMADRDRLASGEPVSYGLRKDGYGPVFRLYKSLYNGGLQVLNPSFAILAPANIPADFNSNLTPSLDPLELVPLSFWQGGVQKSGWAACDRQAYLELRPESLVSIPMGSTLMLQFQVTVATLNSDRFTRFDMKRTDRPGVLLPGCWYVPAETTNLLGTADWQSVPGLVKGDFVPTLEFMAVNYADAGHYVSHVYDTKSEEPKTFSWAADVPSGATLAMYARAGDALTADGFGIADALDWERVQPAVDQAGFAENTGRYVQFRALFTAQPARDYPTVGNAGIGGAGPYRSNTPRLRYARFTWDGAEKYVDVAAELLKSPDCGIFKVDIDGRELVQGVTMEIDIFKDVRTQGGGMLRLRSAMTAEVEPRNSRK
jgi:prepilin-type N-terminal cleavage/methylation domain-containing protein